MEHSARPDPTDDPRWETVTRLGTILMVTGGLAFTVVVLVASYEIFGSSGSDRDWNWIGVAATALGAVIAVAQIWVGALVRRHDHRARLAALAIGGANALLFLSAVVQSGRFTGILQLAIAGACFWVFVDPDAQDLLEPAPETS